MAATTSRSIFVNLPVRDLKKSMAFFSGLGFQFNPQFTDEKAACMIVSGDAFVMLLTEPFFKTFTKRELCDTARTRKACSRSRAAAAPRSTSWCKKAIAAGGTHAMDAAGSRLHVRLELLRPRRPSLGSALDGSGGDQVAARTGHEGRKTRRKD